MIHGSLTPLNLTKKRTHSLRIPSLQYDSFETQFWTAECKLYRSPIHSLTIPHQKQSLLQEDPL